MRGKALESAPLYTEQCLLWLKMALEVATTMDATANGALPSSAAALRGTRYASSEEEEEALSGNGESSESSVSSAEEGNLEAQDTLNVVPNALPQTALQGRTKPNTRGAPNKRRSKINKGELNQHQSEIFIRKQADSIPCWSIDLGNGTQLELPSCLLSKDDLLSESLATPWRSYLSLSSTIGCGNPNNNEASPIVVLFLRSGRFAGAVFVHDRPVVHRTSVRYTVRKGQGKAQSAQDAQKKAQSMGAQLRRQGEISLQADVATALHDWRDYIAKAALVWISVPRTMQKQLLESQPSILKRDDPRIRRIPMDIGRPAFETVCLIYAVLTQTTLREKVAVAPALLEPLESHDTIVDSKKIKPVETKNSSHEQVTSKEDEDEVCIPLSALHIAAQKGDVDEIQALLANVTIDSDEIHHCAGPFGMTPLHYAADSATATSSSSSCTAVDPGVAADCVLALLECGRADPCQTDSRLRVPYYLASHDVVRDAFRRARANLGEDYCLWDENAKVGPALTPEAIDEKNEKEAEKRRKKRAKLKEKKARENAEAVEAENRKLASEEQQKQEEEAKRCRNGLKAKTGGGGACDFCQVVCVGRKRALMLKRLEYSYCSSDCVQKHKRELMAAAATSRLGGDKG